MAKSPTEQIRDLSKEVTVLTAQMDQLRDAVATLAARDEKQADRIVALERENALVRQRLDDHLKRVEDSARLRWTVVCSAIVAVLSVIANAIITWSRR